MISTPAVLALALAPTAPDLLHVGPPGSGAAFEQIQPAVDAAQPGDTVLVAPGAYEPFVLTKPLRVFGAGSALTSVGPPVAAGTSGLVVRDLPAGGEAVVSGFEVLASASDCEPPPFGSGVCAPFVLVRDNAGSVSLHDVVVRGDALGADAYAGPAVEIESCLRVLLLDCDLEGNGGHRPSDAVRAEGTELFVAGSTIAGGTGTFAPLGGTPAGGAGLDLDAVTLHLARTTVTGGDGDALYLPFPPTPTGVSYDGGDAVFARGSVLELDGGPGTSLEGGRGGCYQDLCALGGHGLELRSGSTATIAPDVAVSGGTAGPGGAASPDVFADASSSHGPAAAQPPTMASDSPSAVPGDTFTLEIDGDPMAAALVSVTFPTGPSLSVFGVGGAPIVLDLLGLFPFASPALDATGHASLPSTVPPVATLTGKPAFFQAFVVGPLQAAVTNPVLVVVL